MARLTLREALQDLVIRCDGPEGVQLDGSNIDTTAAHAALEYPAGERPDMDPGDVKEAILALERRFILYDTVARGSSIQHVRDTAAITASRCAGALMRFRARQRAGQ